MSPSSNQLDRNLAKLLKHAYCPVRARAEFERDLRRRFLSAVERRAARGNRPHRNWWPQVLAAAALILLLVRLFVFETASNKEFESIPGAVAMTPVEGLEQLLGQGLVAVRRGQEDWRELSAQELEGGLSWADARWQLATPQQRSLELPFQAGVLALGPGSRVALGSSQTNAPSKSERGHLSVQLSLGAARLRGMDRNAEHVLLRGPDLLPANEGQDLIRLLQGDLSLRANRLADGQALLSCTLEQGAAFALSEGEEIALDEGRSVSFRGGVLQRDLEFVADATTREGVQAPDVQPDSTLPTLDANAGGLLLEFTGDEIGALENLRIGLTETDRAPQFRSLDLRALNASTRIEKSEAQLALTHFLSDLEPGNYTVQIAAEGWAQWRRADVQLVAGQWTVLAPSMNRGGSLRGRVFDRATGKPIAGAHVFAQAEAPDMLLSSQPSELPQMLTPVVQSDSEGFFELGPLSSGSHQVRAQHAEYATGWSEELELSAGAQISDFELELGQGGRVVGQVNMADGRPWSGVEVVATLMSLASPTDQMCYVGTQADESGAYVIERMAAGMVAVVRLGSEAHPEGYQNYELNFVSVEEGGEVRADFRATPNGTNVVGKLSMRDGSPIAFASLSLMNLESGKAGMGTDVPAGQTGADGSFSLSEVRPGTYQMSLTLDYGRSVTLVGEVVVPDWPQYECSLELDDFHARGSVSLPSEQVPVEQCVAMLQRITSRGGPGEFVARAIFGSEGEFDIPFLSSGLYRLHVFSGADHGNKYVEFELGPGEPQAEPFRFELTPGGSLDLTVQDLRGEPIGGAQLRFVDASNVPMTFDQDSSTNASGKYDVRGLQPGAWYVQVRHPDYEDSELFFEIEAGASTQLFIQLERSE